MDRTLYNQLFPVVRRFHFRRVMLALAFVWSIASAIAGGLYLLNQLGLFDPRPFALPILVVTGVVTLLTIIFASRTAKTTERVAHDLEQQFPELDATLLTAIEQEPFDGRRYSYLQRDVLRRAVAHSFQNHWPATVPGWQMLATPLVAFVVLASFAIGMIGIVFGSTDLPRDTTIAFNDAVIDTTSLKVSVEPGDTEVERGTSLLVLARFETGLPPETKLIFRGADGLESTLPMNKSLEDPVFGGRIPDINEAIEYSVSYAAEQTDWFDVTIFEFPKLMRADANLKYPNYTKRSEKRVQDFRRISAVQGTVAEVSFFLNKPMQSATLVSTDDPQNQIELVIDTNDPKRVNIEILMDGTQKFALHLIDADGRQNRTPPKFVFKALDNKKPDLKLLAPSQDLQPSPLEEIQMKATVWDDFGIEALGLSYVVAQKSGHEIELETQPTTKRKRLAEHILALEELDVEPDDLVSYYFWAEDIGPDGERRRVESDMFFAEVRAFEEIFREGQAPPGGQDPQQQQGNQNTQQAQQLAELQKEIIGATWKLIRRESTPPSELFQEDVEVIRDSQMSAIAQLEQLEEGLEDPESKSHAASARSFIDEAVLHLNQAKTTMIRPN